MPSIDNLKISIVTPVYNGEAVIKDLIYSVLDQDYLNWEMIVQDGDSNDNTMQIINDFDDKRIKKYSEKDNGMYDGLNKAIKKATGDYIIHLNSDEQLMEGALSDIVDQINEKPKFNVFCFGVIIIDKKRNPRVYRAAYPQKSIFIKLFNLDILTAGIVYKKGIFDEVKFSTNHRAVSDALLFINLVKNFKIYYSHFYTSYFLIEGRNLSLEEVAVQERKELKSSVYLSSLIYYTCYYYRKFYKLYHNIRGYTGPKKSLRLYEEGQLVKKDVSNLDNKLSWKDFE